MFQTPFSLVKPSFYPAFVFTLLFVAYPSFAYAAFTNTELIFGAVTTNTHTWASADIGTASANRKVIVFIEMNENGNAHAADGAPSSVTIGGISATKIIDNSFDNGYGNNQSLTVWTAAVPTGTAADIVASGIPSALYNGGLAILTTTDNIDISAAHDFALLGTDVDGGNLNLDVLTGGLAAGAGVAWPASGHTWTGLTEQGEVADGDDYFSVATYEAASDQLPLSVTISYSAQVSNFVTVSFAPLPSSVVALSRPPNNLGLVGYWSFDDGTGTVATDFSGRGNQGTFTDTGNGLPVWTNGKRGKAVEFDANHVDMGDINAMDGLANVSVVAWLKASSPGVNESETPLIVGKASCDSGGPFNLFLSSGVPSFLVADSSSNEVFATDFATNVDDGNWHFLVGTFDGSDAAIWVDGVQTDTEPFGFSLGSSANHFEVGGDCNGAFRNYYGTIDDVRVYSRVLGATEIAALARGGAARLGASSVDLQRGSSLESGLVGHWTFDGKDTNWTSETTGTTADQSGSDNTGTMTNMSRTLSAEGGRLGQGIRFDGADDYIAVTSFDETLTSATFAVWAKVEEDEIETCEGPIYSRGTTVDGIDIASCTDISRVGYTWDDDADTWGWAGGPLVPIGKWFLAVAVIEPTRATVYAYSEDGLNSAVRTDTHPPTVMDALELGRNNFGSRYSSGVFDDARIYNRALSEAEVRQLYNLGQVRIRQ